MGDIDCISYRDTGYFSELICDYLEQKPELQNFYNRFPTLENFQSQIEEKGNFPTENREVLVQVLKQQYELLQKQDLNTEASLFNIQLLSELNTFTVTTGHQLNIFTGPLYFLYKIVNTINLARKLQSAYPGYHFVPVYWMASEDHDFEEINFINLKGKRFQWQREFAGPVGRFDTQSIKPVIDELEALLGPGSRAAELTRLFRRCYMNNKNLADATRQVVHELFGAEGLVIIDGDDPQLKKLAALFFERDLFGESIHAKVEESTNKLEELYFGQVHPREINLFYIKDNLRERIEKKGDQWLVLNTKLFFSENELRRELENHPERFSPNVVLRPLYQELILPNLAYIGGGGELAYWLQLKDMFDHLAVPFPMLVLRNSVLWVDAKRQRKLSELGLQVVDLFQPLHELKKKYVKTHAPVDPELDPYEKKLKQMFDDLEEVANLTDRSMLGAVNAQRQKQLNGLENLKKKLIRAEKRRQSESMDKLEKVYFSLFPNESLQERHNNLSPYFCEYGEDFIQILFRKLDPLDFRFRIIKAD